MKIKILLMFLLIAVAGCDSEVKETPTEVISEDVNKAEITKFIKDFGEKLNCTPSCSPDYIDIKIINTKNSLNLNYHIDFYKGYVTKLKKSVVFRTGVSDYIILDGVISESEALKKIFKEIKIKHKKSLELALRSLNKRVESHKQMADVE